MRQQPTSVSVINSQTLAEHQVASLKDMSSLVPNFFIPEYGSRLTSAIYIRGVGSRINTPAVGLYVDNTPYIDKSAFDFNLYDIERVDVLRGPQGTLYGRNTMGGLVRVFTKSPFAGDGTDVNLKFSTRDNHYGTSVTHRHRISNTFALSAGGYYEGRRGMFANSMSGQYVDGMKSGGGRLRGILLPTDRWKLDLSISYDNSDEGGYPYYYEGVVSGDEEYPQLVGLISNGHEAGYRRSLFNAGLNAEYVAPAWQMNSATAYQSLGDRMTLDQDFLQPDIYTMEQHQRINTLNEELTFRSRRQGTGKPLWEWVSGAGAMYQWLHTEAPVTFHGDGLQWLGRSLGATMPQVSTIPMLAAMGYTSMDITFRGDRLYMGNNFDTPTLGLAAFHQSTLNIPPRLSASLGLRFDYEHLTMDYDAPADAGYTFQMPNATNPRMAVSLDALTSHLTYHGLMQGDYFRILPKAALKYDLDADCGNIYLSVSEGMRSGGYNLQMFSDLLQGALRADMTDGVKQGVKDYLADLAASGTTTMPAFVPGLVGDIMDRQMPQFQAPTTDQVVYRPEYSWNYELGTHLNLARGALQVDASTYIMTIRNQQIARFADTGLGRKMVNAGRSRSYGAELTTRWTPDTHIAVTANYGYTHSIFTHYDDGSDEADRHNYIPFVPQHTIAVDAAYRVMPRRHTWLNAITLAASLTGAGRIYWTEDNRHFQNFYTKLGARVMFHTPHMTVSLWGDNLAATRYNTFYFESANHAFTQHGRPLQFGIDVRLFR